MNDSMLNRVDDEEPVTISEAQEIPQPRAVGSPLPRGIGNRVSVPPTYADLEDRMPVSQLRPVLAPPPSYFSHNDPMLAGPVAEDMPGGLAPQSGGSGPAQASLRTTPASPKQEAEGPRSVPPEAPAERPRALQKRPAEQPPSALRRAAGFIRQAIPVVQKLLPLLDGNIAAAVTNLMSPSVSVAPAPTAALPDLAPIKENIADLELLHKDLRGQIVEQGNSLKRVEDRLELVREATDRNTLEQQELLKDLKAVGFKIKLVAAAAIGLLVISLLANLALYMHIKRVLP